MDPTYGAQRRGFCIPRRAPDQRAPFESNTIVGLLHTPSAQPMAYATSVDSMYAAADAPLLPQPSSAWGQPPTQSEPSAPPLAALGGNNNSMGWGAAQADTPSQPLRTMGRYR